MADVFISYSRRDSRFVSALADGLRLHGKDVWLDIQGIRDAEVFPEALSSAIGSSDGFVFVISPASVESLYCMREVGDAVDAGKRIVPVDFEHVPAGDVPEAIRVRKWIPAGGGSGGTGPPLPQALHPGPQPAQGPKHWGPKA